MKDEFRSKLPSEITTLKFEIQLENRYPCCDPQIFVLTNFAHRSLSLADGRNLFDEVVGENGWKNDLPLYKVIYLLPEFVEDMLA